ncbi:DNA polymerase III subunit gamma/tau [Luteimonas sp. JM171]|uniref:DNA polymerase III subunit gamma/tau n=1 Tax=Luteimonas sp. JM171 TaxID=1896164 RepID=UPI000858D99C|nr:DNA polymerase III subunit gamma/tau [Luteimonas sp. JM171]AOH36572.1 DNA polymerase III subunit gamma/tau [Luteimonas sp. JM171]
MSYLVLARKWRPRRFAELVGQEHVVRALSNALDSGRVHHALLFTGTRGVGKTTIARIFAKSLNCEHGTSAEPCGECSACRDIDAGRFVDLLEIDAASNTGVDDVRELIDNAQYMPSRGRIKVYLIDEVHMLTRNAFNALLKTLEEPPEHVKFLLATTDPQKLPVTVLSRCLQFNLKRLDLAQIEGQISRILEAEGIPSEPGAVRQLAKAADGSLRDGLSLLDQAIAYTGGRLDDAGVATMLGTVDRTRVGALLDALAAGDGERLLAEVETLAGFSPDWGSVLDALAEALHRIQVRQLVPGMARDADPDGVDVDGLARAVRAELVQLWYQMALTARRDLPLAPSARAGFEMGVLRMLAFRPAGGGAVEAAGAGGGGRSAAEAARAALESGAGGAPVAASPGRRASPAPRAEGGTPRGAPPADVPGVPAPEPAVARPAPDVSSQPPRDPAPGRLAQSPATGTEPAAAPAPAPAGATDIDAARWPDLVTGLGLRGPVRELAAHTAFVAYANGVLELSLPPSDDHLKAPFLIQQLAEALSSHFGAAPTIRFSASAPAKAETLHQRNERKRDARQREAESAFLADPDVQRLLSRPGASVVPDSIRPFDDN